MNIWNWRLEERPLPHSEMIGLERYEIRALHINGVTKLTIFTEDEFSTRKLRISDNAVAYAAIALSDRLPGGG